jgi:hypothetical protein
MKGKALSSAGTDKAADTAKEPRTLSRLVYESGGESRALTPDSFDTPTTFVRPHSELEILQGDYGRRPRYMGRRARRG